MKTKTPYMFAVLLVATVLVAGCREKPALASPACAELGRTTDTEKRADLLKKCPRGGPDFKPSQVKNW